jgi:16S rRNA A1518/A1519 N6-dimethyltransferase RsmA/KsgA/DIM1 with predicted DNA glycosylase/AP lyase activity
LRQSFGLSAEGAEGVLQEAGIDENARAEMLSVNDFAKIASVLKKESHFFIEAAGEKDFM